MPEVKRVPFRYTATRVPGTLDYVVVDSHTKRRVGSVYKSEHYEGDDLFALQAAQSAAAVLNRKWADAQPMPVQMRENTIKRFADVIRESKRTKKR